MTGVETETPRPLRRRTFARASIATGLRNEIRARWDSRMGAFEAPWLLDLGPSAADRLAYLILLANSHLERLSGGEWACGLDDLHHPLALICSKPGRTAAIPLTLRGRCAVVGNYPLSLAVNEVGVRLTEHLAARLASFFGTR